MLVPVNWTRRFLRHAALAEERSRSERMLANDLDGNAPGGQRNGCNSMIIDAPEREPGIFCHSRFAGAWANSAAWGPPRLQPIGKTRPEAAPGPWPLKTSAEIGVGLVSGHRHRTRLPSGQRVRNSPNPRHTRLGRQIRNAIWLPGSSLDAQARGKPLDASGQAVRTLAGGTQVS